MALLIDHSRTADSASLLRPPNTLNCKYDPPRAVTLAVATWKYFDNGKLLLAIDEAYARFCPAPVVVAQPRAMVGPNERFHGPPDMDRLRTVLSHLDPDVDEEIWKLRRIAPLARAARDYPDFAEDLRKLAIEWSGGALRGAPSRKWTEPGGNGLTGEQYFDQVWNRFLREGDRDGSLITLGTIFHDARPAGGPTDVLPAEPLSHLQSRYGLILQGGDLYGVRLIDGDSHQLFIKERAFRRLMRRDLKKRFPGHDPHPIVDEFFDSPLTTLFQGVYCHPTEERPDRLNLWRGPVLEPKPGDCSLITAFLLDVICDGDEVLYEYLRNWHAHLLQHPEEKPGVIIILIGGQGIGKGTFGYLLRRIFGDSYLHVGRIETVLGNFNGALERSYVVFLDEAFFFGDRRHTEALKSLVTEPTVTINEKHQPTRQVESFHRFVIATNAGHVKHTDSDDRRDLVLQVSDRHQGDSAYWNALYAQIKGDGTAAFMHDLSQVDLSDFDVRQRPVTAALTDQKMQSLDDIGQWWYQCLQDGHIEGYGTGWPEFLPSTRALELIVAFAGGRLRKPVTSQKLKRRIPELCPSAGHRQRRMHGERPQGYTLPSLEVARSEFEQSMEGEIDWGD